MKKVKEKIKLGNIIRKANITTDVLYDDITSSEGKDLLGRYIGRYDSNYVTCISYNGGGDFVNYGLNTFVRDIYIKNAHVIYSDRFGRYRYILNDEVATFISNSKLFITAEGVLLFYNKKSDNIYATLDCKVGYFFNVSSFESEGFDKEDFTIDDISIIHKRTYIKIEGKNSISTFYYALNFSFNLYESYGTQVIVNAVKVDEGTLSTKNIESYEEKVETNFTVMKNSKAQTLSHVSLFTSIDNPSSIFDLYGLYDDILREKIDKQYSTYRATIETNGEFGVCDCINAFVKKIIISRPSIITTKGFFKKTKNREFKNCITRYDRFNKNYTCNDITNLLFNNLTDTKFTFVSTEGVIVIVRVCSYSDIRVLISLDGIIWKEYNISEFIKLEEKNKELLISFVCKDNLEYIKISTNDNSNICEIAIDFNFNFWDLYGAPVEATFTLME